MRRLACILAVFLVALSGCAGRDDERNRSAGKGHADDASGAVSDTGAPEPAEGYNVRQGKALYLYYCATCHGDEGHGDGLNAYNLDPKPRDLASPDFQQQRTNEDLMGVIRSGGGVAGMSTAMPPWGKTLGDRKIQDIVDYLRTMREPDE